MHTSAHSVGRLCGHHVLPDEYKSSITLNLDGHVNEKAGEQCKESADGKGLKLHGRVWGSLVDVLRAGFETKCYFDFVRQGQCRMKRALRRRGRSGFETLYMQYFDWVQG